MSLTPHFHHSDINNTHTLTPILCTLLTHNTWRSVVEMARGECVGGGVNWQNCWQGWVLWGRLCICALKTGCKKFNHNRNITLERLWWDDLGLMCSHKSRVTYSEPCERWHPPWARKTPKMTQRGDGVRPKPNTDSDQTNNAFRPFWKAAASN